MLDEAKCRENIRFMAEKARRNNVLLRPHFKTHQSLEIGNWFREEGVNAATVSSLSMAQYFTEGGWEDITVAFPVNILEIDLINDLAKKIRLNLLVESRESIQFLAEHVLSDVNLFIKIDVGTHRTGIVSYNTKLLDSLINLIQESNRLHFKGFLSHAGHSYTCRKKDQIIDVHEQTMDQMVALKRRFKSKVPNLILSVGDTPTCSVAEDLSDADEIRPGNFVFYDLTQCHISSCTPDKIAMAMACPVVAIHKEWNEILIQGGAVHFAKDYLRDKNGVPHFGQLAEDNGDGWGQPIAGAYLRKVSQEHGTVVLPDNLIDRYKVGDVIKVLPVHSCHTANVMGSYVTLEGKVVERYRYVSH